MSFNGRWTVANGLAEALGLGTTFLLGLALAPLVSGTPGVLTAVAGIAAAVALGTLLEGLLVGAFQARVLRTRFPEVRLRAWVMATAVGAGVAWLVGMVPSTIMMLTTDTGGVPAAEESSALLQYALAVPLGAVTGPILGSAQWVVLRRHVSGAERWLWANALAWAVGMPVIFMGMDFVPWDGSWAARTPAIYAVCGMSGLAVGAIHGRFLVRFAARQTLPPGDTVPAPL